MSSLVSQTRGFIFLLFKSSQPSSIRPLTACLCNNKHFKRYSQEASKQENIISGGERAPSTAEVFKKVAEEKLRAADQGVASQTSEKVYDGAEEATLGDSTVDSVKERLKQHEEGADYRKRADDEDDDDV